MNINIWHALSQYYQVKHDNGILTLLTQINEYNQGMIPNASHNSSVNYGCYKCRCFPSWISPFGEFAFEGFPCWWFCNAMSCLFMASERALQTEGLAAVCTLEGLLSSVNEHVLFKIGPSGEALPTDCTQVGKFIGVSDHMFLQDILAA